MLLSGRGGENTLKLKGPCLSCPKSLYATELLHRLITCAKTLVAGFLAIFVASSNCLKPGKQNLYKFWEIAMDFLYGRVNYTVPSDVMQRAPMQCNATKVPANVRLVGYFGHT